MAKDVPLGMEFMNWQNLPSLTQTLAGGKSPLLNTLGIMFAGGSSKPTAPEASAPPPAPGYGDDAMGQGVAPPMGGNGQTGMQPRMSVPGMSPGNFLKTPNLPELPALNQQPEESHENQINSFWGV